MECTHTVFANSTRRPRRRLARSDTRRVPKYDIPPHIHGEESKVFRRFRGKIFIFCVGVSGEEALDVIKGTRAVR
jgi:hypothetical protein